ncbi:MAG: hypothetical protein ACJ79E_17250 [Anaeromyxobacteraceae bacterium]
MPHDVECTHCGVLMTSWSPAGGSVRYWQCPFCNRTHSSLYSEVFRRGAGARRVGATTTAATATTAPQATPEEIRWAGLKVRAARWFARLEQEVVRREAAPAAAEPAPAPAPAVARAR